MLLNNTLFQRYLNIGKKAMQHEYVNYSPANLLYTHQAQHKYVPKMCYANEFWGSSCRIKSLGEY